MTKLVSSFRPDDFFTAQQQIRLQEQKVQFHEAVERSEALSFIQQQELENLVEAEARGGYFSFC
ncbi:hypothetical protein [Gloeothece verrucosa]|uniref:Uncharacterized protein n=1 Tax=Gloeothece verrucosa (strain PCC 7822) TaxID=497965 RepID=E0UNX1_GLOV7|nr:hypothetical protein [Gloeothece verrucosa]ADN18651.1 hypothetical protein Cyan7822_6638 [Gloeothece verrucosa PCC 7822]